MKLIIAPNSTQFSEIEHWLIEEEKTYYEGFYCNWNLIENSFNKKQLFAFEVDSNIIGFLTYTSYLSNYVDINIMSINPLFRNKGFGTIFYEYAENYFKENNYLAIKLFCSPISSEIFWKKMNFIKFPNRGYSDPELTYYKPLIEINPLVSNQTLKDKVELWNIEPYQLKEQVANWTWDIKTNKQPILHPCNPDWNLKLTKNGRVIKQDKVKYFDRNKEIEVGPFLFIEDFE